MSRPVQKVLCSVFCVSATASHGPEQEMGARRRSVGGSVEAHFAPTVVPDTPTKPHPRGSGRPKKLFGWRVQ